MSLRVLQPGIQTTVQDLGRLATQHLGIPVGGAMDVQAHRVANLLVGNPLDAAALECAFGGLALEFIAPAVVALAGRDIRATLDGTPLPAWHACRIDAGRVLTLHAGCRTTIAIAGGIDVPMVLGSRSTSLRAAFGGWHGRALRKEDLLPVGTPGALAARMLHWLTAVDRHCGDWTVGPPQHPPYSEAATARIIPGPELARLTDASRAALFGDTFRITAESDRMGYRIAGPSLSLTSHADMVSSGVTAGTIQLPPGGAPIVLLADRQTTGGYPRLGDVIAVDLPLLAQLLPGDRVSFAAVSLDQAHALLRRREADLTTAARALALRFAPGADGTR